jgi:hypothetical protein
VRALNEARLQLVEPGSLELRAGDWVIVESPSGESLGRVVVSPDQLIASGPPAESTGRVVRKATREEVGAAQPASETNLQIPSEWSEPMATETTGAVQNEWEVQRFANGYVASQFGEDAVPGGEVRRNP